MTSRALPLDPHPSPAELRAMMVRKGVAIEQKQGASRSNSPKAPSVRPWGRFRSKWELDYARYLDVLKATRRIVDWDYEPERLEIGAGAHYTPDFRVMLPGGGYEFREVKGYQREAAMVRLKVAAKHFPHRRFVLVTRKRGDWVHKHIPSSRVGRPAGG